LADGTRIQSAGWHALADTPHPALESPSPVATVYAAEQAAKPEHELTVTVDLAQIDPGAPGGARVERPYLAIWIEDKDKVPVRTLTVRYRANEARFLADLRAWYRADRIRALSEGTEILPTVSSAT